MKRAPAIVAAGITAIALACAGAVAAEWPSKPVRVVVPFAAGGSADTFGRLYAEALTAALGKQFYVENRVGGGGLVGTEGGGASEPDGSTLMVSGHPDHVLGPAMRTRTSASMPCVTSATSLYFAARRNTWWCTPLGVSTYRSSGIERSGSGLEYVSAGFGTMGNWVAEYLAAKEAIKLTHGLTWRGAQALLTCSPAMKVAMLTWSTVRRARAGGRLVALAVTAGQRLPQVPDADAQRFGHADFVATAWYSLSGPAGLSPDIVAAANREVIKAMDRPQVKRQIEQDAIETQAMSPAQLARFRAKSPLDP